jgi:hypothetical protein
MKNILSIAGLALLIVSLTSCCCLKGKSCPAAAGTCPEGCAKASCCAEQPKKPAVEDGLI